MQAQFFPVGAVAPPMDLNPIWQVAHGWAVRSTHRARAGGQVAVAGAASSADAALLALPPKQRYQRCWLLFHMHNVDPSMPFLVCNFLGRHAERCLPMATGSGQILGPPLFGLQLRLCHRQQGLLHLHFWIGFLRLRWPWKTDVHRQRQWPAAPGKMSAPTMPLQKSTRMCQHPLLCRQRSKGIAKNRRIWS